jgi:hypothetical protein
VCPEGEVVDLADRRQAASNRFLTAIWKERETGLEPATFSLEG